MIILYLIVFLFLMMLVGPIVSALPGVVVGFVAWFGNLPVVSAAFVLLALGMVATIPKVIPGKKKK